jgi:ribosome-associated protein
METCTVQLETEFVLLAAVLKLAGLVGSGGEAKQLIRDGLVHVNGAADVRRGAKIRPGDVVTLQVDPPVRISVIAE